MHFNSAIYRGTVFHKRLQPKRNAFSYQVYMMYLDLNELDTIFDLHPLWSKKRWAPVQFKRSDFIGGDTKSSIYQSVQQCITEQTGKEYQGQVRILTNLRHFGYTINPISNYYCFDESGENLEYVIAAVTNTPWRECHYYVLKNKADVLDCYFEKDHHVSPFMPMNMRYKWRSTTPDENLLLSIKNELDGKAVFSAAMTLSREEITTAALTKVLCQFPLMTIKVAAGIYWQALKLWFKGIRFYDHPKLQQSKP